MHPLQRDAPWQRNSLQPYIGKPELFAQLHQVMLQHCVLLTCMQQGPPLNALHPSVQATFGAGLSTRCRLVNLRVSARTVHPTENA